MDTIKTGIIGYGKVGKIRKKIIDNNPKLELVGINDKNKIDDEEVTCPFYKNYKDLLNQGLDAVFVCTPNKYTPIIVMDALNKNKHVFCEKPPGQTVEDVKKIISVEEKKPELKLKFGFNHRYHDGIIEAKSIVDSGRLGPILWMRGIYGKSGGLDFEKEWRSNKDIAGGGILLDQGIHMLDLFRYFCGDFDEVKSFVNNSYWDIDMEDNAFAIFRNKKNQTAMLHSSSTQWKHMFRFEVFMEKGYAIVTGILSSTMSYGQENLVTAKRQFEDEAYRKGNPREEIIYFGQDNSWKLEIDEFTNCILNDKPIVNGTSHDALSVMEMIYRIYSEDKKWKNKMKEGIGVYEKSSYI